jgi:hypothetical protein
MIRVLYVSLISIAAKKIIVTMIMICAFTDRSLLYVKSSFDPITEFIP